MNVFEAGVAIYLTDKVSGALGQVARSLTKTQAAATALQARLDTIHATFSSGLVMAAGGVALAAPLIAATKAAMDLQTALGRVQIATGASNEQMNQLNETLTQTANATGIFSKPKLAAFAADMYASGIAQVSQINELLPLFAKGADLMKIMSAGKISPEEAAHTFSALAHQFGRYDAASMKPIVEAAVAIAPALPGGLKTLRGMGGYVNVMGNRMLGIDPVQLMALQAAIAQTSGGQGTGRGGLSGAQLINTLQRSMPGVFGSGLLSGKSAYSAEVLGLAQGGVSTVFKNQKLDLPTLIDKLSSFESMSGKDMALKMLANSSMLGKKAGEERAFLENFLKTPNAPKAELMTRLLKSQYGSASTIAQLLGDEKFKNLLKSIEDRIRASKGIDAMQAQAMTMLGPQLMRLQTNFTTLASTIGMQMIPAATAVVTKIGDILNVMNAFAEKHPTIVKAVVALTALASGALILGGALAIASVGFAGLQLLGGAIAAAFSPTVLIPAAIAVGAVAIVVANWGRIMGYVHQHQRLFIHIAAMVVVATQQLGQGLTWLWQKMIAIIGSIGKFLSALPGGGNAGGMLMELAVNSAKIDDLTAKKDEKTLRAAGLGNLVDTIKGSSKTGSSKAPVVNDHSTNHFTVQQVPGHDHQACLRTLKKAVGSAAHATSAGSGNSVGRSINQGGATRP